MLTLFTKSVRKMAVQQVEAVMPLLQNVMKAIWPAGKHTPAVAALAHDGDEIFLADPEMRKRDGDLAILRALCS